MFSSSFQNLWLTRFLHNTFSFPVPVKNIKTRFHCIIPYDTNIIFQYICWLSNITLFIITPILTHYAHNTSTSTIGELTATFYNETCLCYTENLTAIHNFMLCICHHCQYSWPFISEEKKSSKTPSHMNENAFSNTVTFSNVSMLVKSIIFLFQTYSCYGCTLLQKNINQAFCVGQ